MAAGTYAQDLKSLCINEVMVVNDSSIVDEYGCRSAWIELFNKNYAPLEISSIYITNDPNEKDKKKMYAVPLGDPGTHMEKRSHIVFFADGKDKRGTFHTNFVLTPGKENWIGIYAADGLTLIDEVFIPDSLASGESYARKEDGKCLPDSTYGDYQVRSGYGQEGYISPGSTNNVRGSNSKVDDFYEKDPDGDVLTLMAMCIVFSALLVLCLCFYGIGAIGKYFSRVKKAEATGVDVKEIKPGTQDTGEEIAAIVMALHEHLNAHDTESTVLTINKVKRAYSPWSSKIYGLRELPKK